MFIRTIRKLASILVLMLLTIHMTTAQASILKVTWTQVLLGSIGAAGISPDGSLIVFRNKETKQIAVIDWRTKQIVWSIPFDVGPTNTDFDTSIWSPNAKYIASLTLGNIYVFDATNGRNITQIGSSLKAYDNLLRQLSNSDATGYSDLKWSADGKQLAVMIYGYILIYDLIKNDVVTIIDLVNDQYSPSARQYLSLFDWSQDGSKLVAFNYKRDNTPEKKILYPFQVGVSVWDRNGQLLSKNDNPAADKDCRGDEFQGEAVPIGTDISWSSDNMTVAIATNYAGYRVCSLQNDGSFIVHSLSDSVIQKIHWTSDQKWLIGNFNGGCSVMVSDVTKNYETHDEEVGGCGLWQWSQDDQYIVRGGENGLEVGKVELPT